MTHEILASEIQQPQYAGMTDDEIVASLNALSAATRRAVLIQELQAAAMGNGVYTALRVAVLDASLPVQLRAAAQTVLDLAGAQFPAVDLDSPASRQMFGVLEQAGVVTAEQAAQIDALADVPGTARWQTLGLAAAVTVDDIQAALDWLAAQEAAALRLAAFAELRERLVRGYGNALARLQSSEASGADAPAWDEVITWL